MELGRCTPDSRSRPRPSVIISPHTAGEVTDWRADLGELFLDNLLRRREGRPLRNVVGKALGYVADG
ncbi:hypothetical protein Z951_32950 [Streptomyces sp. PRh5]|uniref:hypothetical protein n=1 Tax=Streptomyces sp. PRh5 TaxID=1158056 RepID=UPI00044B2E91|nr:hypothetical protein [Streptomyces sp. PRh5]EXU64042.1 hypothetical protein Z951_32950 [Streptomyces sp. PRh5]